jgi:GNAT superfamily N-acetyltransferase
MSVRVRRADKADVPAVAKLAMKLVEQHIEYDPVRFARISTVDGMQWFYGGQTVAKDARVLIAEIDSQVVGFAYVSFEERNYADLSVSSAKLQDIYVDEHARGTGAGTKLIEAAIIEAKGFGAAKILLSVAAKNLLAKRFFENQGFRTTMHEMMLALD